MSLEGPLRIPLQSQQFPRSHLEVEARNSVPLQDDLDLDVHLGFPHVFWDFSRVEPSKSNLLSSWKTSVKLPVVLTIGIQWLSLEAPRGLSPDILF